jgi:hypothetical protein
VFTPGRGYFVIGFAKQQAAICGCAKMATIILAWELGTGLGHLVNLLPFVHGIRKRGCRIVCAVQELAKAEEFLGAEGISYLQAPIPTPVSANAIDPQRTFAHILHNHGFGDHGTLRAAANAWRNLFELIAPDLIVFDHSPTALLAARGLPAKRALIGTGFFCPLDEYPLADLRPWLPDANDRLCQDEDRVLDNANYVLSAWGQPPLGHLSRLFHDVDEQFLVTLPELDHYQDRRGSLSLGPSGNSDVGAKYWGVWPNIGGRLPLWPEGPGKRVFAYLKPFPALPRLLQQLCDLRCRTIVHGNGADANLRSRFASATMRFENDPLDLAEVGTTCDLAILNGNHGTTVSMLLAGKPTLQVPLFLEQGLFSQAVARLGAAVVATPDRPLEVVAGLMELLGSPKHAEAARRFAARYTDYDPQRQIAAIVDRMEELLRPV